MNLYNKIYEAINTGIQKALALDDEDVSIIYQHKKITNNENLFPYYVSELLAGNCDENTYSAILDYKNTGYVYIAKDIIEVFKIFEAIKKCTDEIDLTWIDTSNALLLYNSEEDTYYSFHQYNEEIFKKCKFIKFGYDMQKPLYLYKLDFLPQIQESWIDENMDALHSHFFKTNCIKKPNETDFKGFENTYNNINIKNMDLYPAINAVTHININDNKFMPYLPSLSELLLCRNFQDILNYAFMLMEGKEMLNLTNGTYWWSSSEFNQYEAWCMGDYSKMGCVYVKDKESKCQILSLFKKIKD
ncbi:MAG: hypothetical protein [Wendovervirus sonii]|uniref:Uncharacterized protein n=1 Tax=phage Lak_Megaphage_Sonny TaxID=3109229 RepID=A0ABZ0Z222_9CAUD|nr:MAG: hypothetical protein [phage Lak_Megaphage_Sonny]